MLLFIKRKIVLAYSENGKEITDPTIKLLYCLAYPYTLYKLFKYMRGEE